MVPYQFPLEKFSLERFFALTASKKLSPGRLPLREDTSEKKKLLEAHGIRNLAELIHGLKTRKKILTMTSVTGIPAEYLVLLLREAKSYFARTYPLSEFPGIPFEFTEVLKSTGIRSTKDFFESFQSPGEQEILSASSGIPAARLREILSLCDLTRITGAGPIYARIIYQTGIRSLRAFGESDPAIQQRLQSEAVEKLGFTIRPPSPDDVRYCVDYARVVTEYTA